MIIIVSATCHYFNLRCFILGDRCAGNSVSQCIAKAMSLDRYVFTRDTQSEITRKNSLVNFPRITQSSPDNTYPRVCHAVSYRDRNLLLQFNGRSNVPSMRVMAFRISAFNI